MATARGKAKAGDHAGRGHRGEQMQALIPANAIAPADIGLAGQPSAATSLRISSEKVPPSTDPGKRLPCQSDRLKFHVIP